MEIAEYPEFAKKQSYQALRDAKSSGGEVEMKVGRNKDIRKRW